MNINLDSTNIIITGYKIVGVLRLFDVFKVISWVVS